MLARLCILQVETCRHRYSDFLVACGHDMRRDKYSGAANTPRKSHGPENDIQ